MEPLLLISEKLEGLQKSSDIDLQKGKGNRDGLIQQIITYVRDGHTITRKQWVRSEFADHAKKNEEEKKKTLLNVEERKINQRKNALQDANAKQATQDKRASKRVEKLKEKEEPHSTARNKKVNLDKLDQYKKKLKQNKKDAEEQDKKNKKDKDKSDEKRHGAYGQQDKTKADNKAEQNLMTRPNK